MRIKISDFSTKSILLESHNTSRLNTESGIEENERFIDAPDYSLKLNEICYPGMHVSFFKITSDLPCRFILENSDNPVVFLFCLNGSVAYGDKEKEVVELVENQQYINSGTGVALFGFSKNTEFICLQLTQEYYEQLTGAFFEYDASLFGSGSIEPGIKLILMDIINRKNHKRVKGIFFRAKIYDLLVHFINRLNNKPVGSLKKNDVDKILYAKKIVEENIQSPCSLTALSRKVGINDYKLKVRFKEITGYTVFGYLYKIRMEIAHHYLSKEMKTVTEVAFLVGYKNAQHFTVAFKKMYNTLPGMLNKNKF